MRFEGAEPLAGRRCPGMQERCVILYTFSKKYAMTGWRLGAAIGPRAHHRRHHDAQRQHGVVHQPLRAVGRRSRRSPATRAGPREMMARLKGRRDAALEHAQRHAGRALPHARDHVLPVSQRHRGRDARPGCADHESFRRARPRPHRRVVLHAAALRPGARRARPSTTCASPTQASAPHRSGKASASSRPSSRIEPSPPVLRSQRRQDDERPAHPVLDSRLTHSLRGEVPGRSTTPP